MSQDNIPTVTIAIPAYNEELNIRELLNTLLKQNRETFTLQEILVYSDGSTDKTNEYVNEISMENSLIHLVADPDKKGKYYRLNEIFKKNKSDYLVTLDADILIRDIHFLDRIIQPLITNNHINMVAANPVPIKPNNIEGILVYATFVMWDYVRLSIPSYDHVQNFYGPATAFRKSFSDTLNIPKASLRVYLYLMAKKTNSFLFLPDVKIYYIMIQSLKEYIHLSNRSFGKDTPVLDDMFGIKTSEVCKVPRQYVLLGIIKSFINQPVLTPIALVMGFLLSIKTQIEKNKLNPLWETTKSAKREVVHE